MNHCTKYHTYSGRQRNTIHVSVCMSVRITSALLCTKLTREKSDEQYKSKEEEERGEKHAARGPHVANSVAGIVLS